MQTKKKHNKVAKGEMFATLTVFLSIEQRAERVLLRWEDYLLGSTLYTKVLWILLQGPLGKSLHALGADTSGGLHHLAGQAQQP